MYLMQYQRMQNITIPAQPVAVPDLPYASFWRRALSNTLDGCLTLAMVAASILPGPVFYWFIGFFIAKGIFYRVTGTSWGRILTKTEVFDLATGQRTKAWRLTLRSLAHIADMVTLVGFLLPFRDPKRQTFADKIMNTVVIRTDRLAAPSNIVTFPQSVAQLPEAS